MMILKKIEDKLNKRRIFGEEFQGFTEQNCIMKIDGFTTEFIKYFSNKTQNGEYTVIIEMGSPYEIEEMENIFCNCYSLKSINFENEINTSSVKSLRNAFKNCFSLENVDLSNFSTKNVISMKSMFENCFSLQKVDLSNFSTENVISMKSMFKNCKMLEIDISNFFFDNILSIEEMFENCNIVEGLSGLKVDFDALEEVKKKNDLFKGVDSQILSFLEREHPLVITRQRAIPFIIRKETSSLNY